MQGTKQEQFSWSGGDKIRVRYVCVRVCVCVCECVRACVRMYVLMTYSDAGPRKRRGSWTQIS